MIITVSLLIDVDVDTWARENGQNVALALKDVLTELRDPAQWEPAPLLTAGWGSLAKVSAVVEL